MTKAAKTVEQFAVSYNDALNFNLVTSSIAYFGSTGFVSRESASALRNTGALDLICSFSSALLALTGDGLMGGVAVGKKARRKIKIEQISAALAQVEEIIDTPDHQDELTTVKLVHSHLTAIYKL